MKSGAADCVVKPIDDDNPMLGRRLSAGGHVIGVVSALRRLQPVAANRRQRNGGRAMPGSDRSARYQQRGLGQAVERTHRLALQSVPAEAFGEVRQCLHPDRFGAAAGDAPAAEIEPGAILFRDLAQAQIIGEVRCNTDGAAILRDGFQPADRAGHECGRRHQDRGDALIERGADAAEQAEIMKVRHPADPGRPVIELGLIGQQPGVARRVAVGDHDATRCAGRAGGVLQHADLVR